MEAAPAKQDAAIKRRSEKRLTASRAFPVGQPGRNKKVGDKGQGKEKTRNVEGKSNLENRG
jgi:hypothetical protein